MGVYYQGSNVAQLFYTSEREVVTIYPRFLVDDADFSISALTKVEDVFRFLDESKCKRLVVARHYALGDLLLLIPVLRLLKTKLYYPHITLVTHPRFVEHYILKTLGKGVYDAFATDDALARNQVKYDVGVHLSGVLERDHTQEPYQTTHRVQIFLDWFGLDESVSWETELSWKKSDYVVLQTGGSHRHKELPIETREHLVKRLQKEKLKVRCVGNGHWVSDEKFLNLIGSARCLITMDSAPLWISHFTKTPTVLILGPTRHTERLTMHPLYSKGKAAFVALNEEIGCESCFERIGKCGGRIDCFNVDKGLVVRRVLDAVRRVTA